MLLQRNYGLGQGGPSSYGVLGVNRKKKIQPTLGLSFGLPQPSTGYPLNPDSLANPVRNPYGPSIGGAGINLGLVSVNPLAAVQITKDDDGEKVIKPLLHFHVTPSEHIVNGIANAIDYKKKKYLLYHHSSPPYSPQYFPHYGLQYSPHYPYYNSQNYGHLPYEPSYPYAQLPPPSYGLHFRRNPNIHNVKANEHDYENEYNDYNDSPIRNYADYSDPSYIDDQFDDIYHDRSLNVSDKNNGNGKRNRYSHARSLKFPNIPESTNRNGQTIKFPENRKKRNINLNNLRKNLEEVIDRDIKPLVFRFLLTFFVKVFYFCFSAKVISDALQFNSADRTRCVAEDR